MAWMMFEWGSFSDDEFFGSKKIENSFSDGAFCPEKPNFDDAWRIVRMVQVHDKGFSGNMLVWRR